MKTNLLRLILCGAIFINLDAFARTVFIENQSPYIFSIYTDSSIKDVLNNQEFSDIMASVGLTLGEPVDFEKIRYSKIVFLADSDVDGGHINTLLTNFFFRGLLGLLGKAVLTPATVLAGFRLLV